MQRPTGYRRWAVGVVVVMGIAVLLRMFVVQVFSITSLSMQPVLEVGDRILVDKISPRWSPIRRGEVVVFDGLGSFVLQAGEPSAGLEFLQDTRHRLGLARDPAAVFVKRVIGVGGDRVRCCDSLGRLEVNGVAAPEPYLFDPAKASAIAFDVTVPEGAVWLLGDHRAASSDARSRLGMPGGGMVSVSNVLGRARWQVWPWEGVGSVPVQDAWTSPSGGQQK